jgi:hypothetical protein
MIRFLEFLPFWQTNMPVVLSTYVHMDEFSMMRKNTRKDKYPFHPQMVDEISSMILADKEIVDTQTCKKSFLAIWI